MSRLDLLALTPDDLAAITNRGTVKRAQKELDEGTLTCEIRETDSELAFQWSDGTVCRFPAGKTIHDAVCSSGVLGISRHVVRSVLAYQSRAAGAPAAGPAAPSDPASDGSAPAAAEAVPGRGADWDPGKISDEDLVRHFRAPVIAKARQRFDQGVLVELVRGAKPLARFLDEPCTLRFLVPGDVRYVTADCSESLLGQFVPLAVWSFRELDASRRSGLVARQLKSLPVPRHTLEALEQHLRSLILDGLQGLSATWSQVLIRHEAACREEGLVWPADLLLELSRQVEMYSTHDALFEPGVLVRSLGELLIRQRAILGETRAIPQVLVRGSRLERTTDLAACRLMGLGCGVTRERRSATITAFLQDVDAGSVMGVERAFADPSEDSADSPRDYAALGQTTLTRGVSLAAIGAGQLLIKSGKLTPSGRLILPRVGSAVSVSPQAYAWEHLKAPLAVEGFAELGARLDMLPPSSLRPRRLTETLSVCPIASVVESHFDVARQRLNAVVKDPAGESALISLPFTTRGQGGFERLSQSLSDTSLRPRFVSGHVARRQGGIQIEPIAVIFDDGRGRRRAVLPWTDSGVENEGVATESGRHEAQHSPLAAVLDDFAFELSELLVNGIRRVDGVRWERLAARAGTVGLTRVAGQARRLSHMLNRQAEQARWEPAAAIDQVLNLLLVIRLADDIGSD